MGTRVICLSILSGFGVPVWGHFGSIGVHFFCGKRVRTQKIEVFFGCLFKVTFLDDFRSDYGVPGIRKTSIWHERGCKNKFFSEVGILMETGTSF